MYFIERFYKNYIFKQKELEESLKQSIQKLFERLPYHTQLQIKLNRARNSIQLEEKYGFNGQNIYFSPDIEKDLIEGDVITRVEDKIYLYYKGDGTFVLWSNVGRDFVTGEELLIDKFQKLKV